VTEGERGAVIVLLAGTLTALGATHVEINQAGRSGY
jgi:hypothetical protein